MIPTQLLRQYRLPWHVEEMRHNFGLVILDELFHRPLLWWCKFMSALTRAAAYKALLNWPINRVILSCVDTVLSTPRKNLMLKRRAVELLLVDAGCFEHSDRLLDAFLHYAILSIDFRGGLFEWVNAFLAFHLKLCLNVNLARSLSCVQILLFITRARLFCF